MAQRRTITVHAWDPYHGDRNNRHPRLGAPVPRRVPTDLWRTFNSIQPALHNNGIFGYSPHIDVYEAIARSTKTKTSRAHEDAERKASRRAKDRAREYDAVLAELVPHEPIVTDEAA